MGSPNELVGQENQIIEKELLIHPKESHANERTCPNYPDATPGLT
jgi:hypothetical protein